MKSYDHILVGQGLAGSVLALELLQQGRSVLVIDQPSLSLSSRVAAGIWNPVVFKRLTKSWLADEVLPVLQEFYTSAENRIGKGFLHSHSMLKLFTEEQEVSLWKKKAAEEMKAYLDPETFQLHHPLESPAGHVLQTGHLDTVLFLQKTKSYLQNSGSFLEEQFDYSLLERRDGKVFYRDHMAASIIFCEGHLIRYNPFFPFVSMKPAKGEVLTIRCKELNIDFILNKNFFILPLGDHLYKVGATYNWQDLNDEVSEAGRKELEEKFSRLIPFPYEVVKHEAGVRPSVIDRRPVLGAHPEHAELMVFNGFGTKAVMLAPYFAKQFAGWLNGNIPLSEEVSCDRFYQKNP